jgi:AraC-like DNA-binding protein
VEFRDVRGLTAELERFGVGVSPYTISGAKPGTHLGLPSPTVTLIVDLQDGLDLSGPGLSRRTLFRCCIGGLHTVPFTIHHDGSQIGVQASLSPGAVRRLFGIPASALGSSSFELADLAPQLAVRLYDSVGSADSADRGRVAAQTLAAAIGSRLGPTPPGADPDAVWAWRRILHSTGRVTVGDLVAESGWSARRLTEVFTAEFGLGPKQAARLVRFDAARRALESGVTPGSVAADLGYTDQSHLSRDFSEFTGHPPRRYLAERRAEFVAPADH